MDVACVSVEYFPAAQNKHADEPPLLYWPAGHGVHALAHDTHGLEPILHVELELQLTHTLAPALDPEPRGHAWHAVAPWKYEKLPAGQLVQTAVVVAYVPGAQGEHVDAPALLTTPNGHARQAVMPVPGA
jgi:hypothetical protein